MRNGHPKRTLRLDFVVCTWNNRDIIGQTLDGIARQTVRDFTCTVVDDCSTDGTPDFIREHYPWVEVVGKEENSGLAPSRNIGLERARGDYVIFMDSDVILEPDWAEQQIRLLDARPHIGIACGKLLYSPLPR